MSDRRTRRAGIGRRQVLTGAVSAAALGHPLVAEAGKKRILYGGGSVGPPIEGVTIPSPSDFGFSVDNDGGTFLCSMFGPVTGGFLGCQLMTTQGFVHPGSLQMRGRSASFSGQIDVFVFPNIFIDPPGGWLNAAANEFTVSVQLGGPDKGRLILHIPSMTELVGGDTGGILTQGRIAKRRTRR